MDEAARLRVIIEALGVRETQKHLRDVQGSLTDTERRAQRAEGAFRKAGHGISSGLGAAAHAAKYAGAALGVGLAYEAKRTITAFQESNKVSKQTQAVLRSTGGAAKVSARHVSDLADALSRKTGVDDETVASGENVLLTFRGIRNEVGKGNDVFDQATKLSLDMSVALGKDLKSSSIQVGKALNDPLKGVTALSRAGVQFTAQQREQIKTLTKSGDKLGAQKIILGELRSEFQGSAKAQATSTDKLKVAFGNLEEDIGSGLAPAVDNIAGKLTDFAHNVEPMVIKAADKIGKIFGRKDLSLEQKFRLSRATLEKNFEPLIDSAKTTIDKMHVGDKLSKAFEAAAPKVADAFASSAPKVAERFIHAFQAAGPWGKLVTLGFLASKLGVFSSAGSFAGGKLIDGLKGMLKRDKTLKTAAAVSGAESGAAYSTAFDAASAGGIGKAGKSGKVAGALRTFGRAAGVVGAIALGTEIANEVGKAITKKFYGDRPLRNRVQDSLMSLLGVDSVLTEVGITIGNAFQDLPGAPLHPLPSNPNKVPPKAPSIRPGGRPKLGTKKPHDTSTFLPRGKTASVSRVTARAAGVRAHASGGLYSHDQLMALWVRAGGPPEVADMAAAIALAESGGNPSIVNSIGATGLWQIHPGGSQYLDPMANARAAVAKYRGAGNRFTPWTTYTGADTPGHKPTYGQFLTGGSPSGVSTGGAVSARQRGPSAVSRFQASQRRARGAHGTATTGAIQRIVDSTGGVESAQAFTEAVLADPTVAVGGGTHPGFAVGLAKLGEIKKIQQRLKTIRRLLRGGHLTRAQRTSLLQEIPGLQGRLTELAAPPDLPTSDTTGTGEDPGQALIDSNNAAAQAAQDLKDTLDGLRADLQAQTALQTRIANTDMAVLKQALGDVMSQQIGGQVFAGVSTPGVAGRRYSINRRV